MSLPTTTTTTTNTASTDQGLPTNTTSPHPASALRQELEPRDLSSTAIDSDEEEEEYESDPAEREENKLYQAISPGPSSKSSKKSSSVSEDTPRGLDKPLTGKPVDAAHPSGNGDLLGEGPRRLISQMRKAKRALSGQSKDKPDNLDRTRTTSSSSGTSASAVNSR